MHNHQLEGSKTTKVTNPTEAFRIFEELAKQVNAQRYKTSAAESFFTIRNHLDRLRASIEKVFGSESQYLRELETIKFSYPRIKQKNAMVYFDMEKSRVLAVMDKIFDELRVVHAELTQPSERTLVIPAEIGVSLDHFREDYSDKTAFIMMSFAETHAHQEITRTIKQTLATVGIIGLRADDKEYHPDLYWNILTYIHGCDFGIAVFDNMSATFYNPNVAFETGYMLALNKRVCLLKDATLNSLQVDLIGKLYLSFDPEHIEQTILATLSRWLAKHIL